MIRALNSDFNWDLLRRPASPGLYAHASAKKHIRWYKKHHVNTIQTFCVTYNGYAWYKSDVAPVTPGMKGEFLRDMVELGHAAGMRVLGYFCLGSNPYWENENYDRGLVHRELGCGPRIPLTTTYLDYFCRSVEDALRKVPMDGFMIDWFMECPPKWTDCEKQMYHELMGEPFPGSERLDEGGVLEFRKRAIDRAWTRIRTAAKSIRPETILWINVPFEKADDPLWTGSTLLREADWLLNEGPNYQLNAWLKREIGPHARVIQNLCGWADHDAGGWKDLVAQGTDLYGFAAADPAMTLPREDDGSSNARNLAVIRKAYATIQNREKPGKESPLHA